MSSKKIHRFIEDYDIENGNIVLRGEAIIHQFRNVLKFKKGEEVIIAKDGKELFGEILEIDKDKIILLKKEERENKNEPEKKVHLYLAILKKENFELAIEKATELGIQSITPIITERTIKTGLNFERLRKIAKEASELSGRSLVPEILDILRFEEALESGVGEKILFDIGGEKLKDKNNKEISIFVGPEGGWTENEINIVKEKGVRIASISPFTLRGETAAIIASYVVIN